MITWAWSRWIGWLGIVAGAIIIVGCSTPPAADGGMEAGIDVVDDRVPPDVTSADGGTCVDMDNDGHPSAACGGDDCDDTNPRINPSVRELCDNAGVDEDCNPCTVAQVTINGRGGDGDRDEDGYPALECFNRITAGATPPVCEVVVADAGVDGGSAASRLRVTTTMVSGTDCADDPNAGGNLRNPGAGESCNGRDDDCDGATDEDFPSWQCYGDADGDGFAPMNAPRVGMPTCLACPTGSTNREPVGTNVDCDDNDQFQSPMGIENCDGRDNDCNPATPDGTNDARVGLMCAPATGVGRCATASNVCASGMIQCRANTAVLEMCNAIDDDCDGMTDEPQCVDARVDAMGRQTEPTGYGVCMGSTCAVSRCADFRGDCDGDASNGCETNTTNNPNHCGGCNVRCGSGECVAGVCSGARLVEVSAGYDHTCARSSNGTVLCWGSNAFGQLGDGTMVNRADPSTVDGVTGATQVDTALGHTCALLDTGRVACWGGNSYGQLGIGSTARRTTPTLVQDLLDAVEIATGGYSTCARRASGGVVCWGQNANGQVGDGTTVSRSTPTAVMGLDDAVEIAVGDEHACARRRSGPVVCWGRNVYGQLGNNSTADSSRPVAVNGLADAVQITAGQVHTCARRAGGSVACWGDSTNGMLGDGTSMGRLVPTAVSSLAGATFVEVGQRHSCAVRTGGRVSCWGRNDEGQLGDGTNTTRLVTTDVSGINDATEVSAGAFHTCVLRASGRVECWGYNGSGKLGDGTLVSRNAPRAITTNEFVSLSAGQAHTCARRANGQVFCWGANLSGALGDGTTSLIRSTPMPVLNVGDATEVSAGGAHTCARRASGQIACWGGGSAGQLGDGSMSARPNAVRVATITDAVETTTGAFFSCARTAAGQVFCWGLNSSGQLGDGTTTNRPMPGPRVDMLDDVVEIASGSSHACARRRNGEVRCWGANTVGQLGDGTSGAVVSRPTRVLMLPEAVEISAGTFHSCARSARGSVYCWGGNGSGQLGDGTQASRLDAGLVPGITDAVEIAAGFNHTCVRRVGGQVLCWGSNAFGQLGDGTRVTTSNPVTVVGLTDAIHIAAGDRHTCARRRDRSIVCWGGNSFGQIAQTDTNRFAPVAVSSITDATHLSAGVDHACVRLGSGAVQCWGANSYGQLGRRGTVASASPVAVVDSAGTALTALDVSLGEAHSCARRSATVLACWGANVFGQLGDGTFANRDAATNVLDVMNATQVSGGFGHTCARRADGAIDCWGANSGGQLGNGTTATVARAARVSTITDASTVTAGGAHSCAVRAGGALSCWGVGSSGQLGLGSGASSATPQLVTVPPVDTASAGAAFTCVRLRDSRVFCWGAGSTTGDGTTLQRQSPVEVMGVSDALSVDAGRTHACAVRATGQLVCWGFNTDGQLGDGTNTARLTAVPVATITDAVEVAGGDGFTCARRRTGPVLCWGGNENGQLGDGTFSSATAPVTVTGL